VRDEIERYQAAGVKPFGVNPAAAESHADYARRLRLPFALLSDSGAQVGRSYGVYQERERALKRSVYLVGRDGRILFSSWGAPGSEVSLEQVPPR
jgi:peroxiredoxin